MVYLLQYIQSGFLTKDMKDTDTESFSLIVELLT